MKQKTVTPGLSPSSPNAPRLNLSLGALNETETKMSQWKLLATISSFILFSCFSYKMNVTQGQFEVIRPPVISGNSEQIQTPTKARIQMDMSVGNNVTLRLDGVKNEKTYVSSESLPDTPAIISYVLVNNMPGISFEKEYFRDKIYKGIGCGVFPYPYAFVKGGYNGNNFDIGINSNFGVSYSRASYRGNAMWDDFFDVNKSIVNENNKRVLTPIFGLGTRADIYYKNIGLAYYGSVTWPWSLVGYLPVSHIPESEYFDTSVKFPYIVLQNVEIQYMFSKVYRISIGFNQITGSQILEQVYSGYGAISMNL